MNRVLDYMETCTSIVPLDSIVDSTLPKVYPLEAYVKHINTYLVSTPTIHLNKYNNSSSIIAIFLRKSRYKNRLYKISYNLTVSIMKQKQGGERHLENNVDSTVESIWCQHQQND